MRAQKCSCKPGPSAPASTTLKNVLIVGDSVSIGYTPYVAQELADVALVQHAPWDVSDGVAEEAHYAVQCLDYWLHSPSGVSFVPDLIYFNSGMHNLVVNGTPGSGTVPGQSGNSSEYAGQLANVTARLVALAASTGTKLVFGITSPMLCDAQSDAVITGTLNTAATSIMAAAGIPTVDLHAAVVAKCGPVPQASCFGQKGCWCPHCPPGYQWLASSTVAPAIRAALQAMPDARPLAALGSA